MQQIRKFYLFDILENLKQKQYTFQDLRGEIQKIVRFLGKDLSCDQLTKLTEHLRFDNFAKNEAVNCEIGKELGFMNNTGNFIRKGKARFII